MLVTIEVVGGARCCCCRLRSGRRCFARYLRCCDRWRGGGRILARVLHVAATHGRTVSAAHDRRVEVWKAAVHTVVLLLLVLVERVRGGHFITSCGGGGGGACAPNELVVLVDATRRHRHDRQRSNIVELFVTLVVVKMMMMAMIALMMMMLMIEVTVARVEYFCMNEWRWRRMTVLMMMMMMMEAVRALDEVASARRFGEQLEAIVGLLRRRRLLLLVPLLVSRSSLASHRVIHHRWWRWRWRFIIGDGCRVPMTCVVGLGGRVVCVARIGACRRLASALHQHRVERHVQVVLGQLVLARVGGRDAFAAILARVRARRDGLLVASLLLLLDTSRVASDRDVLDGYGAGGFGKQLGLHLSVRGGRRELNARRRRRLACRVLALLCGQNSLEFLGRWWRSWCWWRWRWWWWRRRRWW